MPQVGGINALENLQFVEADLTKDHNWDDAVKGCHYILQVASPTPLGPSKDENDMIRSKTQKVKRHSRIGQTPTLLRINRKVSNAKAR
jgi:dihydroflavonol-4-reductase